MPFKKLGLALLCVIGSAAGAYAQPVNPVPATQAPAAAPAAPSKDVYLQGQERMQSRINILVESRDALEGKVADLEAARAALIKRIDEYDAALKACTGKK